MHSWVVITSMTRSLLFFLVVLGVVTLRADDFQSGDVKIHYTVQGSGPPLVLIHGLHSSAQMNWTLPGTTAALVKTHKVIAMDCRGHGASDKPESESAYGVAMVEDVVRLLDHLGIQKAHIAGYSMGGMIALKLAVMHPERCESLLLCGMGWLRDGGLLQEFWQGLPARKSESRNDAAASCMRGMAKLAVTESEVKSLKLPAAIIVGDKDPCRALYVEPLTKVRPDWPVTLIPRAGHLACVIKPDFRDAVAKAEQRLADRRKGG
jgi:pimeloyl-ACP methyl ester carboxylesterase